MDALLTIITGVGLAVAACLLIGSLNERPPVFDPAAPPRRPPTAADRRAVWRDWGGQIVLLAGLAVYWSWLLGVL